MKSRMRYVLTICLSALLAAAMLCQVTAEPEAGTDPWNYGFEGAADNKVLSPSELFGLLADTAPTDEESAYLNTLTGQSLIYNDAIPDSMIETDYLRESGKMKLMMSSPYRYTASNGLAVEWIPQTAVYAGREVPFLSDGVGGYIAVFDGVESQGGNDGDYDFEVDVHFSWTVDISAEQVNALLTAPYEAAAEALELFSDHEQAVQIWREAEARYQAYTAYMASVADYEEYERKLAEYQGLFTAYQSYLGQLHQQKLYDDWQAFHAYQSIKEQHLLELNRYLSYRDQVSKAQAKLGVLENLFVKDSHGWELYASLMGSTVTAVVSRKDELVATGVPRDIVNKAGEATEALRVLMGEYAKLRNAEYVSEHDKLKALYAYYSAHYTELRDEFFRLYGSLHDLYLNDLVVSKLKSEGKLEHYQQFVGVLYITRSLLDDSFTLQSSWRIGKKTLGDVVEACNLLTDTVVANPSGVTIPEAEVAEVIPLPEVPEPTEDQPQTRPDPAYMEEPIPPTPVANPNEGVVPPYAEYPGEPPAAPSVSPELQALYEALKEGRLPTRSCVTEAQQLTFKKTVSRLVSNDITITFYRDDGSVLERYTVKYNPDGWIECSAPPEKASDERYHYKFDQWVTRPNNERLGIRIYTDKDRSLYPSYEKSIRYYTVTWILNGESKRGRHAYGYKPVPMFTDEEIYGNPNDVQYSYRFSGWDRELVPITGDVTFCGTREAALKTYTVTWRLGNRTQTDSVEYGKTPVFEGLADYTADGWWYQIAGWDQTPRPVNADVTYTAQYREVPLVSVSEGALPAIELTDSAVILKGGSDVLDIRDTILYAKTFGLDLVFDCGEFILTVENESLSALANMSCRRIAIRKTANADGISCTVSYYNNLNREIKPEVSTLLRPMTGASGLANSIYVTQNGNSQAVDANGTAVTGGFSISLREAWRVTLVPVRNCNISQIPISADVGQTVNLNIGCTFGYRIASARVTLADGTEVAVNGLCFVMPRADVTVELEVVRTVYHVTFVADGVVISEKDYFLGDRIEVPADPVKPSDDRYDYMFAGWSADATLAMGDELSPMYEAIFIANERFEKDPSLSTENTNRFMTVYLPIIGGVLLIVGLVTFLLVRARKTRQPAKKRQY